MYGAATRGPVTLSFTYAEDEYISAAQLFYSREYDTGFTLYLGLAVFACGLFFSWLAGDVYIAGATVLVGLLMLLRRWYVQSWLPRSYFRSNPLFREPYELTFAEEGILFRSKGVESRLGWEFYTKVVETPDYFFLVYGRDMFSLLPKRVLRGPFEESALRELFRRKLGAQGEARVKPARPRRELEREYVPPSEPPDWR